MSPSVLALTSRTRSATSPDTTVVFCQAASVSVVDSTYFGIVLMYSENGTSGPWPGQNSDHSS